MNQGLRNTSVLATVPWCLYPLPTRTMDLFRQLDTGITPHFEAKKHPGQTMVLQRWRQSRASIGPKKTGQHGEKMSITNTYIHNT